MKKIFYLVFLLSSRLYSQDVEMRFDSLVSENADFYQNKYSLRNSKEMGGEGWETRKDQILMHAFYGDFPANPYYRSGRWELINGSIIFHIENRKLIDRYGYHEKESFTPFAIFLDLKTDLRNIQDSTQILVIKNKIIILNTGRDVNDLFNDIKAYLSSKIALLKKESESTDPYFYFELNESIKQEFSDYMFEKTLLSSISTTRAFE
jgi:hypothetical protein